MKGVIISKTGGVEVLEYKTDLPLPELKEGQVLIKNNFIGVNYIDTYGNPLSSIFMERCQLTCHSYFRTGLYPAPKMPYMLGREGEGTIVSAPSGTPYGFKEGDNVVYLAESSYAEYTAAAAEKTAKIPSAMEPQIASAALLQGITALTLIREAHHVKKGDWVLVHAAAGGVGLWLCQLLRSVGAHTIGTASTKEKCDLAKKNGAEHLIDYSHEDVKSKVMELTDNKGVIAVFDGVGKATFDVSLDCLARKGTLASFGNASGSPAPLTIA